MKKVLLGLSLVYGLVGCVSKSVETAEPRYPAGVGDVGSSTDGQSFTGSYRLPLERNGEKKTRVAYTYWSGEWPQPIPDVSSTSKGTTTIAGYPSPRVLKDRTTCTIKNGIYHPWSEKTPSLINFYAFTSLADFEAVKDTVLDEGTNKVKVPKGAKVIDVIALSEGWVSGVLKIGQSRRVINVFFNQLYESKDFVRLTPDEHFYEQWLHLECSEKDASGKARTIFVQDADLMSQPGVKAGTFNEYGKVKAQ